MPPAIGTGGDAGRFRTVPLLPRSDDAYESIERVRTELMLLTGYFHTESSHHASEYWAWFRKTPELVDEYLDRRWNYLEVSRSSDASQSNTEIVADARASGIRHGGEFAAPIIDSEQSVDLKARSRSASASDNA